MRRANNRSRAPCTASCAGGLGLQQISAASSARLICCSHAARSLTCCRWPQDMYVYVAINPDRSDFIDTAHPYLTQIDGRDVNDWLVAAKLLTNSDDSVGLIRLGALTFPRLRDTTHSRCRLLIGLSVRPPGELRKLLSPAVPAAANVSLTLSNKQRVASTMQISVPVAATAPEPGLWPRGDCRSGPGCRCSMAHTKWRTCGHTKQHTQEHWEHMAQHLKRSTSMDVAPIANSSALSLAATRPRTRTQTRTPS